jgi:hypothetical protein
MRSAGPILCALLVASCLSQFSFVVGSDGARARRSLLQQQSTLPASAVMDYCSTQQGMACVSCISDGQGQYTTCAANQVISHKTGREA